MPGMVNPQAQIVVNDSPRRSRPDSRVGRHHGQGQDDHDDSQQNGGKKDAAVVSGGSWGWQMSHAGLTRAGTMRSGIHVKNCATPRETATGLSVSAAAQLTFAGTCA